MAEIFMTNSDNFLILLESHKIHFFDYQLRCNLSGRTYLNIL